MRRSGTTKDGGAFDSRTIEVVWRKGQVVPGYDPSVWRKDRCGAWMQRGLHGVIDDYGWEVDHVFPVSQGGTDDYSNLQPLQWRNNRGKGDNFPRWSCLVSV